MGRRFARHLVLPLLLLAASARADESAVAAPPAAAPEIVPVPPRFTLTRSTDTPGGWIVRDSDGTRLDSTQLASALGDTETLARLRGARTLARVQDGILLGGAAALATFGTFSLVQAGPAIRAGRRPDPQDYPDYAVWRSDEDAWEDRLAGADLRDERIWTGVTLYTGAALLGVLVPLTGQETRLAAAHPGLAWPDLRARLGPGAVVVEGALP